MRWLNSVINYSMAYTKNCVKTNKPLQDPNEFLSSVSWVDSSASFTLTTYIILLVSLIYIHWKIKPSIAL